MCSIINIFLTFNFDIILILIFWQVRNMIIKNTTIFISLLLSLWLDDPQLVHLSVLGEGLNLIAFKYGFYNFDCFFL
jgi:hypothetical protein